jgi:hypothetical protein
MLGKLKYHKLPWVLKADAQNNEGLYTADGQCFAIFYNIGHEIKETAEADKETDEVRNFLASAPMTKVCKTCGQQTWQSIESAPKDKTTVLLYNGSTRSGYFWSQGPNFFSGWTFSGDLHFAAPQPTHWMFLPPPPTADKEVKGKCPRCNGIGMDPNPKYDSAPCKTCKGTGLEG